MAQQRKPMTMAEYQQLADDCLEMNRRLQSIADVLRTHAAPGQMAADDWRDIVRISRPLADFRWKMQSRAELDRITSNPFYGQDGWSMFLSEE